MKNRTSGAEHLWTVCASLEAAPCRRHRRADQRHPAALLRSRQAKALVTPARARLTASTAFSVFKTEMR